MQRTKSKILSILLSLVMLLSLLPTTALAAGIPDPTAVSVDGGKFFQASSKLYYKNGNGSDTFTGTPSDYNAHYDPNTGTLTLQGYEGGSITLGGAIQRDLTIKLIGDNKITVNGDSGIVVTSRECNITITADSGDSGKLTIDVTSDSGAVVGIGNNIATGAVSGNVTITGHADVTINATTNAANWSSWGIYAGKVIIEDHAKVAITVNAPKNTGGDFVYGIFAQDNVTINTDGEITVDASNAATVDGTGDRVYSIGVYAQNSLTLTKVGGMMVKWNNNQGSNGHPLSPSASFDTDAYDNNVDKTTCTATYMPKVATPTATVGDVTINGTTGTAIADTDVIITLANDTFASTLSGSWITNLPNGLSQSVSRTDDTHAKITVSGNPSVASSEELAIKIPTANLVTSTSDLDVTSNANAKFAITAPATPITDTLVTVDDLTGKTYDESAQEPTFGGGLIRDTDYTVSYEVKSGFTGTLNSDGKPVGAGTYVVTVTGKDSYTGSFTKDFEIGKATPVYTAPTAKTGLAYTGSALDLIDDGTVTKGGEMQYKLSGGSYGTTIPTATDAGNYTVYFKIVENNNYNPVAETQVGSTAINIAPANQSAPTGLGVAAPITSSGNGKITGTTTAMEYSTDSGFISPAGTTCTDTATEVAPGTYYVRYKADANHNAGTVSAALVVPAYSATPYSITVNNDGHGTANANKISAVAGETITLTAAPNTGYIFDKWDDKTPSSLIIGTGGTFTMPSENVSVKAYFKPAALTGTVNITGALKYGQELTATLTGDNNTGNLDYKWYQNGTTQVAANNTGKYTLRADDIGKTITVKITSNVQTGEISGSTTGTIDRADGPEAPSAFTLTFTPNADGTTFTATIPTVTGGEYSFDGTNYSATNTKADCAANTSCTGYVRIAATSTRKASAATCSTQTSPKLTVATPTFTPNGVSSFTGTQSVKISCTTVGATIHYTTDGTAPTASSPVYSTELSLTSTTTVKAIAVKAGMNDSATATATFTKYSGGGGGGGSYTPSYTVSVDKTENGTITVSPKSASKGDTVTITVTPDKGYELDTLKVLDKNGDKVKLTEKNGKYTFTMPTGKVTVKGSFVEEAPVQIFKDVPVDAYYYEAVKWAAEKGITGGVGNGLFAPNQPCTRGQIVTFLWRAAGSPAPKNMSSFADVPADAFYAKAVAWAVENGITGGTGDGKFSPDATCTRAQSVTFLYRAAGSPKVSSSAEFGDVATNAYYADAVAWAAKNGITDGIGGGLFGSGNDCTRAQIVTFLYRSVK